jgi:DnaJ-domain-containing protein 1
MGQLLNRLRNFAKAHLRQSEPSSYHFDGVDEDAELKQIIDELTSGNQQKQAHNNTQKSPMDYEQACNILKIHSNSSVEEIKNAYKQRIKEYHPDRVENLGEELRQLAKQKSQQINEAYQFIKKVKGF